MPLAIALGLDAGCSASACHSALVLSISALQAFSACATPEAAAKIKAAAICNCTGIVLSTGVVIKAYRRDCFSKVLNTDSRSPGTQH
jgi:hypothetical protein